MERAGKVVLIIEDDKGIQSKVKNDLKEKGYKVAYVNSAQEGIDYCIKNVVDIVLMDLNLPDRDGMYGSQVFRKQGVCSILIFYF